MPKKAETDVVPLNTPLPADQLGVAPETLEVITAQETVEEIPSVESVSVATGEKLGEPKPSAQLRPGDPPPMERTVETVTVDGQPHYRITTKGAATMEVPVVAEIMDIHGIGETTYLRLWFSGYTSKSALKKATDDELLAIDGIDDVRLKAIRDS